MKKMNRAAALVLSAALLLTMTACANREEVQEESTAGVAVQVQQVKNETIAAENTVSGTVTADNEEMILIAVTAKCTKVYAHAGDTVQAGDILCTLDMDNTLSSYNAANIGYQSAQQSYQEQKAVFDAQVALQQKTVNDLKALFAIGAASQMEIDGAELQLQSAIATRNSTLAQLEAGIQNAKSGVEQLEMVLEHVDAQGNVIAPISGTLVSMTAVENSFVSSQAPLAVIDAVDQMKVTVMVSETLVPKLSIGDKADVTVSAANQTFEAEIRSVDRAANAMTKLYSVTLTVPAGVSGLMSGMFADVEFRTEQSENAVVVPTEAILTSDSGQHVFVVEGDSAKYVEVTTGLTGSGITEITSGLAGGELVVTVGQAYLEDGAAVRVVAGEE